MDDQSCYPRIACVYILFGHSHAFNSSAMTGQRREDFDRHSGSTQ